MCIDWTFKPWDALFSLLGISIAGYIGYKSARQTALHEARNVALAKFRAIFVSTLSEIELLDKYKDLYGFAISLKSQLSTQTEAIENFRYFIRKDSSLFQSSWDEYKREIHILINFPNISKIRLADDSPRIAGYDSARECSDLNSNREDIKKSIYKIISSAESCSRL